MAEEWDVEDFDPDAGFKKLDDRWEGEDEELELLTKTTDPKPDEAATASEKKSKQERIEEKKAQRRAEEAAKLAAQSQPASTEAKLTPEELQEIQREKDLEVAKELFKDIPKPEPKPEPTGIDAMNPTTVEEFKQLEDALVKKMSSLETSPHFVRFLEDLMRRVGAPMDVEDLRRISNTISSMANEKQKAKQAKKTKKSKTVLGSKAAKKMELSSEFDDFGGGGIEGGGADDFDFM